jgi:hypothetical protein
MKCRPLRRRYLLLETSAPIGDQEILSAVGRIAAPIAPLRIVYREGPFIILRLDNRTLGSLREHLQKHFPLSLRCGDVSLHSIASTGTIKKAKEKIKKSLASLRVGDEEAVPVKQKSKDVDKLTD